MIPVRVHPDSPIVRWKRQSYVRLDRWRNRRERNDEQIAAQRENIAQLAEAGQQEDFSNDLLDGMRAHSEGVMARLSLQRTRLLMEWAVVIAPVALLTAGECIARRFNQWMSSLDMHRR